MSIPTKKIKSLSSDSSIKITSCKQNQTGDPAYSRFVLSNGLILLIATFKTHNGISTLNQDGYGNFTYTTVTRTDWIATDFAPSDSYYYHVDFPVAFPTACINLIASASYKFPNVTKQNTGGIEVACCINEFDKSEFTCRIKRLWGSDNDACMVNIFALGY